MIRVGFIFNSINNDWLGGLNYFRNLLYLILGNSKRKIEPVILTGCRSDISLLIDGLPPIEVIRTSFLDSSNFFSLFRKFHKFFFLKDIFLEKILIKNKIVVLSHSGYLGAKAKIPTLGWIPDFQHKYLPNFFSKREIKKRNKEFEKICKFCTLVIVSSYNAQNDLINFSPECSNKCEVLHFVAPIITCKPIHDPSLDEKFSFDVPYFYIPNQFWKHKNHKLVIDALKILNSKKRRVLVIATGKTYDYRDPGYFINLMKNVQETGLTDLFKVLGVVDYQTVLNLMQKSIAIINPSLFEGWSTVVEEANFLGKKLLLSDIPVHREQVAHDNIFFNPNNPDELANLMWSVWQKHDEVNLNIDFNKRYNDYEKRRDNFIKKYERLVVNLVAKP